MNAAVVRNSPFIRVLLPVDLDRMAAIESRAYARGWSRGIFADCLRSGYFCRGLESGGKLAGYCIASAAAGESHLLNLAVDPDCQQCGFGRLLLDHALEWAREAAADCMFLEVRVSNTAARGLYLSAGFTEFGRRRGYYPPSPQSGAEDALILCRRL